MKEKIRVRIIDLDGTLADTSTINHYVAGLPKHLKNYEAFHIESADVPSIPMVVEWIREGHALGEQMVVLTGRKEMWRELSATFWDKHVLGPFGIELLAMYLRPDDDERSQVEWKTSMIEWLLSDDSPYQVTCAAEDRPPIVEAWERHGVPVLVVPGWNECVTTAD